MGYYYTILHQNPQLRLNWFLPMIKKAVETGEWVTTKEPLPINGLDYTLYLTPVAKTDGRRITLSLNWEDDGENYTQDVTIRRERSNLKFGYYVYYFLCPYGYKSRKLFYILKEWRSRRSFRHGYSCQRLSHHQRETSYLSQEEPYKLWGKPYYRDRLTPYGRRCQKYENKQEAGLESLANFLLTICEKTNKLRKK